ncbi:MULTISPECIES: YhdT family protein [unclassified Anaerobiospirillum]|uniref:YhdT family protein n=1 Tax=unclassified Anaerobiospirillum TaxID=2647410 RepID=UPI001FF2759D|nr:MULTISPECIES: YhdT family protein [unclassified Anaerobiospirillum]MCK0535033.1 YhdT family protein [Anaerobiospirillum sp. NML120511]MCK0540158.1 YhdT family protein [Anaerobiospirillum sp. NML02-A-032]
MSNSHSSDQSTEALQAQADLSAQAAPSAPAAASGCVELTHEQYAAQFSQLDSEALYTFLAAVLVTVCFWLAIFLTHDSTVSIWHMPLWFVLSCLGGYVLSVGVVIVLVKFFMKPCVLNVTSVKNKTDRGE